MGMPSMSWNLVADMVMRGDLADRLELPEFDRVGGSVLNGTPSAFARFLRHEKLQSNSRRHLASPPKRMTIGRYCGEIMSPCLQD